MSSGSSMSSCQSSVSKMYKVVIEDVINNVKESFFDEGIDESVLQELKAVWEAKLAASKAMESAAPVQHHHDGVLTNSQFLPHVSGQPSMRYQLPQSVVSRQLLAQTSVIRPPQGQQAVLQPPQYVIQHGPGMMRFAQQIGSNTSPVIVVNSSAEAIRGGFTPQRLDNQQSVLIVKQQPGQSNVSQVDGVGSLQLPTCSSSTIEIVSRESNKKWPNVPQVDGPAVLSDDESDDEFVDDDPTPNPDVLDDEEEEDVALDDKDVQDEGQPLGPEDDISDEEDPDEMFEAENVVVCQYEKINRTKNKWKLVLKDGIMNLNGRDYVFQKATGEAEW